jgi:thioredoxin reductase (NADPH)
MPRMTGVEYLEKAIEIFPEAKRDLLTAYADTDAAIRAINEIGLDYYLQKPWDPPEEHLYPILDDQLEEWLSGFRPPFEGMRLVGNRWSSDSHRLKDFLARNRISYRWLDVEGSEEARQLVEQIDSGTPRLPLVVLPDGPYLENPQNVEVAEKIGLKTRAERPFYDLVIVGAGPAGLAAAVYGVSEGLHTILLERKVPGGQAGTSSHIDNYLGFPSGLSGGELTRRAVAQTRRFGAEILTAQEVKAVRVEDQYRIVTLADGTELSGHVILIATGVSYRRLDAPGTERLTGAGVYYGAAMTEAFSCRNGDVYIVGGANSAGQAAMYLSQYAGNVTLLVRGGSLEKGMSQYLVDEIKARDNIHVRLNTSVVGVDGEQNLENVTLKDSVSDEEETVPATGLFIFIGAEPGTDWLEGVVKRDERGFILSGPDLMEDGKRPKGWMLERDPYLLETSVPGIFVAGDVRYGSIKRVASGVGEGSIAVKFIHQYLKEI